MSVARSGAVASVSGEVIGIAPSLSGGPAVVAPCVPHRASGRFGAYLRRSAPRERSGSVLRTIFAPAAAAPASPGGPNETRIATRVAAFRVSPPSVVDVDRLAHRRLPVEPVRRPQRDPRAAVAGGERRARGEAVGGGT